MPEPTASSSSAPEPTAAAATATVRIEADVYSGRPNPRWTLSAAQAATLIDRLRVLPAITGGTPRDALGYRGLVVHFATAPDGLCRAVRVGHGLACCEPAPGAQAPGDPAAGGQAAAAGPSKPDAGGSGQAERRCRRDANRELERWLVTSGEPTLEPGLLKMLQEDLKTSP